MTLEEIQDMWTLDAEIDRSQLGQESLRGPVLHAKYFKLFGPARIRLKRLTTELKQLSHAKFVFYSQGPTKETQALGWKMPPCGKILKGDAHDYVTSDPDVVAKTLEVAEQSEIVDILDGIIKHIKDRGFAIKGAIDWEKFLHGQ